MNSKNTNKKKYQKDKLDNCNYQIKFQKLIKSIEQKNNPKKLNYPN